MAAEEFITQLLQLGVGGIDLKRSIDLVSPLRLSRMTNLTRDEEGRLASRPGQRRLTWGPGGLVHSLSRIQTVREGGEYVRLAGIDSGLFWGTVGSLSEIARDFSGQPLSMVPGHPPQSGDSWMYVGDSARMVKVRSSDRLTLPIGLAPPTNACTVEAASDNRTVIDLFEGELPNPTGWTGNAGNSDVAATTAWSQDAVTPTFKQGISSLDFCSHISTASAPYYNYIGKAYDLDLSKLSGISGVVDASDDDQFHLWLRITFPSQLDEFRVYFVVSPDFDATVLPGTNTTKNREAYVKSFIPAAFTPIVEDGQDTLDASASTTSTVAEAVQQRLLEEALQAEVERLGGVNLTIAQQDEIRASALRRLALGIGAWTEFGVVGTPLRRGEFLRIGSDTRYDWSTVTGIVFFAKWNVALNNRCIKIDDFYLRGGYNPDTSDPTSTEYDYRYRHVDPRTGAKSRFSPVMDEEDGIDALRQVIRLRPDAYGDSAIRQEFFRRGGTLPSNWYYVGRNTSDGGCGLDNVTDTQAVAAGTTDEDDYHQPVTTVDKDGDAIYAQPLPIIFGPAPGAGILFGLGDPYRPGHAYWSLPDEYDHWPLSNNVEVCSPEEELMNGGIFGGQAFALSRERMHALLVSIVDSRVKSQPTACAKGLAARWGMAVGLDGIYFVAADGIYKTTGGTPQNLTDDFLEPLFHGERKNGYAPVDWLAPGVIRLKIHLDDLWFLYQDVDGNRQVWIYSLIFQFWRHYEFGWPVASLLSETYDQSQLLLGSATTGRVYVHDGFHDDGLAITASGRTGALNQGAPRQDKLYGDIELEADLQGMVATIQAHYNQESQALAPILVSPQIGPTVYLVDAFGSTPLRAKDVSIDFMWSSMSVRPWIGRGGPSFVPQPESAIGRVTEWNNLGSAANKLVKGVLLDIDTFGFLKTFQVVVDGGTVGVTTFQIQTVGRDVKHVAFTDQIEARNVRLVPTNDSPWLPYDVRWVFDLDPLELTYWRTQPTDHGIPTEQTLGDSYITLRSTTAVTLSIVAHRQDGTTTTESVSIPSTGGEKEKTYVKLPMLRGVLFQYTFSSPVAHRLYREESSILVQPWGAEAPIPVQPFGTDNLDVARVVRDAEGAALRGARWLDTSARAGQT